MMAAILVLMAACQKYYYLPDDDGEGNKIKVGTWEMAGGGAVFSSGGSVNITGDNPISGMEINVEPGSFDLYANFLISYAEIKSHDLGEYFNPVTPLIKISCDGGFAGKPIRVKIPISLPENSFAMGFFYNDQSGKLEGLPIDTLTPGYIIVSTRHFTTRDTAGLKSSGSSGNNAYATLVISSILESVLNRQDIISTAFTPGIDDWEFINFGSYISPGGHCEGQCLTAAWYYYEKRLRGQKGLFHTFDKICEPNTPSRLWQDNPLGYRFASTIQEDANRWFFVLPGSANTYRSKPVWYAFLLSMLLTGEPQICGIGNSATGKGHAILIYRISVTDGIMYTADPNFPNNRSYIDGSETIRTIDYRNGFFVPYNSAPRAGDPGTVYDEIEYTGKSALIDWDQITRRWSEFEAGTIGNDRFPGYGFYLNSSTGPQVSNNMYVEESCIQLVCRAPEFQNFIPGTDKLQEFDVFDAYGNDVGHGTAANDGKMKICLNPGRNTLGFYIKAKKDKTPDLFVDFKWLVINYLTLSIDPDPLNGIINQECTFNTVAMGLPGDFKFVWNFGDNTPEVTIINDTKAVHKYQYPGDYIITLKLFDNADNSLIRTVYSTARIKSMYETLFIEPEHLYGQIDKEYKFIARTNGDHPADYRFEWNFGDGTPDVKVLRDSTVTHTYTKEGEYDISVALYNNATNDLVNAKSAAATITSDLLAKIKTSGRVSLNFLGEFTYSGSWCSQSIEIAQFDSFKEGECSLKWTGNTFDFTFNQIRDHGFEDYPKSRLYGYIKGEVSADGTTINWLNGYRVLNNQQGTDSLVTRVDLGNLQYFQAVGNTIGYQVKGPATANVVTRVEAVRSKFTGESGNPWSVCRLLSVDYGENKINILQVDFRPRE